MNGKDWKVAGQLVAIVVRIWTIIKRVVDDSKVGLEMLDWIVGQGETFFTEWFATLVEEYKRSVCVDFSGQPHCPAVLSVADERWQIRSSVKGVVDVNGMRTCLHTEEHQRILGKYPLGQTLSNHLVGRKVCGAQLLDFYLSHPDKIPDSIREKLKERVDVFFWGTIYVDGERLCVRFLRFEERLNSFIWGFKYLSAIFGLNDQALILVD